MRIAILRCEKLPKFVTWKVPVMEELFDDDMLLIDVFNSKGHKVEPVVWDKPDINWNEFDMAIVRSVWDYIDRREEFLNVLSEIESSSCKLFNSFEAIKWNSDKLYFFDLQKWNIPIVPTYRAEGFDIKELRKISRGKKFNEVVLKPTVGGGGADVYRVNVDEIPGKLKELKISQPHNEYLVQPLIESVMSEGEWSYVYAGGKLSHVLLKKPAAGNFLSHVIYGGSIEIVKPGKDDILMAEEILSKLQFDLLYARLDLVRIGDKLAVMEVELIEPILYFNLTPGAAGQLANAALENFK